jgi:radical SAM-linked protein
MMNGAEPPEKHRLRLVFAKKNQVKYISHLDLALAWERALRRAQMPLAYSQGFNPRPKMQFASGLPLGATGSAEIVDIVITEPISPEEAQARISPALPRGLQLQRVEEVPLKSPTLQQLLRQAEYRVVVETELPAELLAEHIQALLEATELIQTRRRRKKKEAFDLRPWLHDLRLERVGEGEVELWMRLTSGQFGNLRPEAVLEALGLAGQGAQIERTRLIFDEDLIN